MAYCGIVPFGDRSVFIWDAGLQHKDYYGCLWDVLHGQAGIEYAAGKSLGGRMPGLIGFYISSPLNLLLYFFKKSRIPAFMSYMIILKIGLCGLTSQIYLRRRYLLSAFPGLLFSTAYALMEYNVYYCRNMMWLDGVMLLPLVALGVDRLLEKKKSGLLWMSAAYAIIANWYTGYMVCLFSGLYFLYEYLLSVDCHPFRRLRESVLTAVRYVVTMLLGVMTAAVMLLPACLALVGGKATNNLSGLTGKIHFDPIHFFSGFEIGAKVNSQSAPVIFCSGLLLICTVYYFYSPKISRRERLLSGLMSMFFIASFCLQDLEHLWTAFVHSASYFFRFSFVVPFFMLVLSCRVWHAAGRESISRKSMTAAAGTVLALFYVLYRSGELATPKRLLVLYMGFLAVTAVFLVLCTNQRRLPRYGAAAALFLMLSAELCCNTWLAFREYRESGSFFSAYVEQMEAVLDEINAAAGGSFFRFERNDSYLSLQNRKVATCESLLFGCNSLEHYSSAYDEPVDRFLAKVGYSDTVDEANFLCETYWNSPLLLMDSLLSVRYALLDRETYGWSGAALSSPLPFADRAVYENMFALPLGFCVDADLGEISWTENPYENQARLLTGMLGVRTEPYRPVTDLSFAGWEDDEEIWLLAMPLDGPLYLYLDAGSAHGNLYLTNCEVYADGRLLGPACCRFAINSMDLGGYAAGDTVEIRIRHLSEDRREHKLYAAQLDTEVFSRAVAALRAGAQSDLNIEKNVISGTFTAAQDSTVFLSIPYEKSWTAWVDGERTKVKPLAGTFIGLDLTAGTHDICLVYAAPGLRAGAVLSFLGILLFALYEVLSWKKSAGRISQKAA